jgi:hypothetical protein
MSNIGYHLYISFSKNKFVDLEIYGLSGDEGEPEVPHF